MVLLIIHTTVVLKMENKALKLIDFGRKPETFILFCVLS
jgi:hypothetical protein